MAINLMALTPHQVSRDLSGYITYLYGQPKVGKTTLVSQFPGVLLLACEKGYGAIPGILVQDITSWTDVRQVLRELKKPEVKERFSTIAIDTIDVAASYCDKWICNKLEIESLGEGGYTKNGWAEWKKEMEMTFRTITNLGYALVFISHDKDKEFTRQDGTKYNKVIPTVSSSANEIVKAMADIYTYATIDNTTKDRKLIFRSLDDTIDCGCRFKYMPTETELSYKALINALNEAIDKEAAEHDNKFVTDEREAAPATAIEYDYDALMNEFNSIAGKLMGKDGSYYGPRITQIVSKILGKGKKVSDTTREQAEFIYLIVGELKDEFASDLA